tara:strand:+ start:212 stop:2380 length:2169 start_codon:yes stop_codon:yes gene_type:complete
MPKWDLQRETQREQLKEQKRQYDRQLRRDLGKMALSAGLNLGTGVASDWAGFELFGGKEKLDAYQRQIAEQETAGAALRKRREDKDLVTAGKQSIMEHFAPQVEDLAAQYGLLATDPEASEVSRRGPAMERRPSSARGGIMVEKAAPERLDPEGFVRDPDASYDQDVSLPKEYEELQTLRTIRSRLEEQYEAAARTLTPAGEAKRARLNRKLSEVQTEMNRLMGISDFVSTGGTWEGVHKPPAKPAPPMSEDVYEFNAATRMKEIVDMIPGLTYGAGALVTGGDYGKGGFVMTPEIWAQMGRDNPALQSSIIQKWNEMADLDYAMNRYKRISPEEAPSLALSSTRQRRGKSGKWHPGDLTELVNQNAQWKQVFSAAPGRYGPPTGASARKKTIAFNNAKTEAGHAIDAYFELSSSLDYSEADFFDLYNSAIPTQGELDAMGEREATQQIVAEIKRLFDTDDNGAIGILKTVQRRQKSADNLYATASAVGVTLKGSDIRNLGIASLDARNTVGGATLQEQYRDVSSAETQQRELDALFDKKVAELKVSHRLRSLLTSDQHRRALDRATEKIGPAAFELFDNNITNFKEYVGGSKAIAGLKAWGSYGDLDEDSKAAVGLYLYKLAQQKFDQSTEGNDQYTPFAYTLGLSAEQLRELTGNINIQALATKSELLDEGMMKLLGQVRKTADSPADQMLMGLILKHWQDADIPDELRAELKGMGIKVP